MDKPVIILGAGSIGKSVMEAFVSNDVVVYGFLDEDETMHHKEIGNVTVMGSLEDPNYLTVIGSECEAFVAIEEIELRKNLVDMLVSERKTMPVNAIHKTANLATSTEMGHGNYIGAGVILGSGTKLGSHLIVESGAVLNHDAELGNFIHIGAGSVINSGVKIEDDVFIGSGVTIVGGIIINQGARIGAGSVVIKDVEVGQTVFGNPAEPV